MATPPACPVFSNSEWRKIMAVLKPSFFAALIALTSLAAAAQVQQRTTLWNVTFGQAPPTFPACPDQYSSYMPWTLPTPQERAAAVKFDKPCYKNGLRPAFFAAELENLPYVGGKLNLSLDHDAKVNAITSSVAEYECDACGKR